LAGLVLAALALTGPAAADAARVHPTMRVAQVEAPPETLAQQGPVTVTGEVANRGKRAAAAKVSATLSTVPEARRGPVRLGRALTATVRGKNRRGFQIRGRVPASAAPGQYYLVTCVRRGGKQGKHVCRRSARPIEVVP